MVIVVALVMLAGVLATWIALLPTGRELGQRAMTATREGMASTGNRIGRVTASAANDGSRTATAFADGLARHWRARRGLWIAACTLIVLPPLLAIALLPVDTGPGGLDSPRPRDQHIARLLHGEQLVPPPALPPEAFTTREVERVRPELRGANRNWDRLDPDFTQRLLRVFAIMREQHGYELVLLEGYRSPERQQRLARMGPHVTNAGMYRSYHQFGLAADVAFVRDGRVVISERDPWAMRGYTLYGEVAEQQGLTWGGNWRMRDYGHVELRRPGARDRPPGATL